MQEQRVRIISSTTIKPSSPTPRHLQTLNLSLLDQLFPPFLAPLLLFYANSGLENSGSGSKSLSSRMRASLSETLVDFYPLAGRLRSSTSIACNDEGVYWVEAQAGFRLADFLARPEGSLLNQFLPYFHAETSSLASSGCILIVQLTSLSCGGVVVAPCSSHKLIDASSLAYFLQSWSARTTRRFDGIAALRFIGDSLMRARELPFMLSDSITIDNCATRRFVFPDAKITTLKAEAARSASTEPTPFTRVELVLALILKRAMVASRSVTGSSHPILLQQMVNLRRKMTPASQQYNFGNLLWLLPILFKASNTTTVHNLASRMRKEMIGFSDRKASRFGGEDGVSTVCETFAEWGNMMKEWKDVKLYKCTSLCRFPFYDIDYGWGKPAWVTCPSNIKNLVCLVDTKTGDGIEAWITLDEREMAVFERDAELLAYAAPNPSAAHVTHRSRI